VFAVGRERGGKGQALRSEANGPLPLSVDVTWCVRLARQVSVSLELRVKYDFAIVQLGGFIAPDLPLAGWIAEAELRNSGSIHREAWRYVGWVKGRE
jgi:hypothetical protein